MFWRKRIECELRILASEVEELRKKSYVPILPRVLETVRPDWWPVPLVSRRYKQSDGSPVTYGASHVLKCLKQRLAPLRYDETMRNGDLWLIAAAAAIIETYELDEIRRLGT